jgi:hypothetical protein
VPVMMVEYVVKGEDGGGNLIEVCDIVSFSIDSVVCVDENLEMLKKSTISLIIDLSEVFAFSKFIAKLAIKIEKLTKKIKPKKYM